MKKTKLHRWLAGALVVLTGLTVSAESPSTAGYSKLPAKAPAQSAKTAKAERQADCMSMVPTLGETVGRLKSMPRVGSRSLVENDKQMAPARITSEEAGRIYGGVIYADS